MRRRWNVCPPRLDHDSSEGLITVPDGHPKLLHLWPVQLALVGLEKVVVKGDEIKQALLLGGSPATLKDVRERFEAFLKDRCKGKEDPEKLRFIIE